MTQETKSKRPYRMVERVAAMQAGQQRILDAARVLFRELPYDQVSLQAVAAQAAVSVQTVLRRFRSKEQLFAAVTARIDATIEPVRDQVPAGDLAAAVRTVVDQYDEVGDEWLHFMLQETRAEPVRVVVAAGRRYHHAWVERVFGPLLDGLSADERKLRLAQITAVLDLYCWKVLRREVGLTREEAGRAMEDLVTRLVS